MALLLLAFAAIALVVCGFVGYALVVAAAASSER
jgi:hypothetical protein